MTILKKYDRWTWPRLRRHLLYWSVWSAFIIIINTLTGKGYGLGHWVLFEATVLPIKISSAYLIAYGIMPRFLYRKQYIRFLFASVTVALAFASLLYLVYAQFIHPEILNASKHYPLGDFIYKGLELIYIAALVMGIKFFQNYLYEQQRNESLARQKVEAELKYLKNQIQPHFLFNSLNNIYGMMLSQDQHAADYMVRLSDLLAYILYESDAPSTPLCKELEMLDAFIDLERLRYQRKLDFQYQKTAITPGLRIAPMLLIPFVENAFKHGPAQEEGQSMIHMQAELQGNILYFMVENSYTPQASPKALLSGIGLENIKKRLSLLYPERHTLEITKATTFKVSLMVELSQ